MSKEGYSPEKKEGDNKVVLERLQLFLKDKRSSEAAEQSLSYNKPSTSFEPTQQSLPALDDNSSILRDVLNHKKAQLLRQPEIIEYLKVIASDLKK